jgi:hypothetical protein
MTLCAKLTWLLLSPYCLQSLTCNCPAAGGAAVAISQAVAQGGCGANNNVLARECGARARHLAQS